MDWNAVAKQRLLLADAAPKGNNMATIAQIAMTKSIVRRVKSAKKANISLWDHAFKNLNKEIRQQLDFDSLNASIAPSEILHMIHVKRDECTRKRWKYTKSNGEEVVIREIFERMVGWIEKFKAVGDIAVQYDSAHAALTWAAIRFFLQIAVNDVETFGAMIEGLEVVTKVLAIYTEVERKQLRGSSAMKTQLSAALVKLYSNVLEFLAKARVYYTQNTLKRFTKAIVQPAELSVNGYLGRISKQDDEVHKLVELVAIEDQQNQLTSLRNAMSGMQQSLTTPSVSIEDRRQKLLQWLGAVFTDNKYDTSRRSRHAKTCDWILQRSQYRDWETPDAKKSKILWIHGPPGFGKTVLCSTLVEHLTIIRPKKVAHFFCVSENEATREPYAILKSWIAQIVAMNDDSIVAAEKVYKNHEVRAPTLSELWLLFTSISARISQATFVVDGFDECTQANSTAGFRTSDGRSQFLQELIKATTQTNTQILMVSRDLSDIRSGLSSESLDMTSVVLYEYAITATDTREDVSCFAASMVNSQLPKKSKALREDIASEASRKCDGMFLWLHLLRDELRPGENAKQLRRTVSEMPAGIEQAYEKDLERISKLKKDIKDRAIAILRWILFAVRPLTVRELCEALVLTFNDTEATYPEDDLPDSWLESYVDEDYVNDVIRRPCGSLVELRSKSVSEPLALQTVHFVHFSVKEYLLRPTADGGPRAETLCFLDSISEHDHLARLCLQYLCYDVFGGELAQHETALEQRLRAYPFLTYAARSWYKHASHQHSVSEDIMRYAEKLFSPVTSNWIMWSQVFEAELRDTTDSDSDDSQLGSEPDIDVGAGPYDFTDDTPESEDIAGDRDDVEQTLCNTGSESQYQANATILRSKVSNPVYYAALLGLTDIIKALHTQGLDCNENGGRYGFPLQAAIVNGQNAAVETLLELGANVASRGGEYDYAIIAAAALGSESVFQLLIKAGAKVEIADDEGTTCLHMASSKGAMAIVKRLLDSQMDVDVLTTYGETPLCSACSTGHGEVVRLLLHHGANANVKTGSGSFPLHIATHNEQKESVEALLTDGMADANTPSYGGVRCLHLAAAKGNKEITQLLLTHGADPNVKDANAWGPLHMAVNSSKTSVAKLLLDSDANVNQTSYEGWAPLHLAVSMGDEETTRLLLDYGANVNAESSGSWTSLHVAVSNGKLPLIRLLLENGADTKIADNGGDTVLDQAIEQGNQEAVLLLLEYAAGIEEESSKTKSGGGRATSDLDTLRNDMLKAAFSGVETDVVHCLESTPFPKIQEALDSSLHLAAAGGSETTIALLLDRGANVNSRGVNGRTALHQAAARGSCKISQLLLKCGAEVDVGDANGGKAIDLAARRGLLLFDIVELLTQHSGAFGKTDSEISTQLETTSLGKTTDFPTTSHTSERFVQNTLSGKWLGTYTYMRWRKGVQDPTGFDIPLGNEKSPAAKNILKGQGKDLCGDFQIRGQLLYGRSARFVKLYETIGWLYHGEIDQSTDTITGNWGRSSQLWCGTFTLTRQKT